MCLCTISSSVFVVVVVFTMRSKSRCTSRKLSSKQQMSGPMSFQIQCSSFINSSGRTRQYLSGIVRPQLFFIITAYFFFFALRSASTLFAIPVVFFHFFSLSDRHSVYIQQSTCWWWICNGYHRYTNRWKDSHVVQNEKRKIKSSEKSETTWYDRIQNHQKNTHTEAEYVYVSN